MIEDARTVPGGSIIHADICIAGGGAAGITLALQFIDSTKQVILLESGGFEDEPATQLLYAGEVADETLHSPAIKYRSRRFGGSTAIWGGRCMPFDPIDFEARPWIAGSGWPVGFEDIAPYYPAANIICEAGTFAYTAEAAFPGGMKPLIAGFAGKRFTDTSLERFSCPTNFAARYKDRLRLSPNVRVLLHANATELLCSDNGNRITEISAAALGGPRFAVRPAITVLAAGGLEIPRLLLNSRAHHAQGIGNAYDQVGRNYLCHIAGTLGEIRPAGTRRDVYHGYQVSPEGIYCRRRFALTPASQRELATGNFVARLHHPRIPSPSHRTGALSALFLAKPLISYEYRKRLHGGDRLSAAQWLAHLRNIVCDPIDSAGFLLHWLRFRTLAARKFPTVIIRPKSNCFSLDFHAEQQPNPQSRITLTNHRDALGLQQIRIDWRYLPADITTVRIAARALAADLADCNAGIFEFDDDEAAHSALRDGAYGGHHIGTARMSASPRQGVVDANARVHGMENLFIASSAIFPTSSQANPTLTIVAFALRLAHHLKTQS